MNSRTFLLLPLLASALVAQAQPAPVSAQGAWVRPTVQGQTSTGAYMTLTATQPVTLVGASTPIAGTAEIHEMRMDGDVMRMRAVEGLAVAPGKPVELKPGGYHVMLTQLRTQLQPATTVPVTLRFRNARGETSELKLAVPVQATAPR
jgi:copper(I)-binding protein